MVSAIDFMTAVTIVILLGLPSAMLAWTLRRSEVPGGSLAAALVAGLVVGLLAGPGVLGQIRPDAFERLFVGAPESSEELLDLTRQHATELAALRATGATPEDIRAVQEKHGRERTPIQTEILRTRSEHAARLNWLITLFGASYLACAAMLLLPARTSGLKAIVRSVSQTHLAAVWSGMCALSLGVLFPMLAARWLLGTNWSVSAAFGLMLGAPAASAALRPPLAVAAYFGAFGGAALALIIDWSLHLTVLGAGLFLGLLCPLGTPPQISRRIRRIARQLALCLFLPGLCALATVQLDIYKLAESSAFWIAMIFALIWSSDGRWFTSAMSLRLFRRAAIPSRMWLEAARWTAIGTGATQLLLSTAFFVSGLIEEPLLAAGISGALLVELTRGLRIRLSPLFDHSPTVAARPPLSNSTDDNPDH